MPEQFTGLVEILNDAGQVVVTINPNEPAAAIAIATANGKTVIDGGGLATDGRVISMRELILGSPSADTLPASFKVWNPRLPGGTILNFDGEFAVLDIGGDRNEGDIRVRDNANRVRLHIDAGRGSLFMTDASGNLVLRFDTELANLDIGNVLGGGGTEGDLRVRDASGNVRIHLDGASGQVITSGADCAEDFAVDPSDQLEPGTVVVVDDDELLRASTRPYDRRVAGVLSGAGGVGPGIILGHDAGGPNRLPLALTGKTWCKVDASYGPIALGDLLTTSSTRGHAMNASDSSRAPGAIIGKGTTPLARRTWSAACACGLWIDWYGARGRHGGTRALPRRRRLRRNSGHNFGTNPAIYRVGIYFPVTAERTHHQSSRVQEVNGA